MTKFLYTGPQNRSYQSIVHIERKRSQVFTLIWLVCLGTVCALSTWPFNFTAPDASGDAWTSLWRSWGLASSRGDIAGNLALFVPVGVFGLVGLASPLGLRRIVLVLALSMLVAVAAQAAQIYLPSRSATLVDVIWNGIGLILGTFLAFLIRRCSASSYWGFQDLRMLPFVIICIWLAYRLAPFIPSIDFQLIKDNLKPLLLQPNLTISGIVGNTAAWAVVALLLRDVWRHGRGDLWLLPLAGATFAIEALVVARDGVSADNVGGVLFAVVIWFAMFRWLPRPAALVWFLLSGAIIVDGLWPFSFTVQDPSTFYWFPLRGILGGSMWLNVQVILEKTFLYTALAYLGWRTTKSWALSAVIGAILLASVEWLQRLQDGHVSEVTDPLLLVIAALVSRSFLSLGENGSGTDRC